MRGTQCTPSRGATCPKGDAYVRQELTDPQRNIATSVLVEGGELPLASVRLSRPISKKDIFRVMEVINTVRLQAPTAVGQVAWPTCGLGRRCDCHQNVARANA